MVRNYHHYVVIAKNSGKIQTSVKPSMCHLKGFDKSCPKMYFLMNLGHCVKSHGNLCQILAVLP